MSIIQYPGYCPNCDYRLTIEEDTTWHTYTISDGNTGNGEKDIVTKCPNCLIPLIVIDGLLRKD